MIVSNVPSAPAMYREPFDGIQLRKLPEPPALLPVEVPGTNDSLCLSMSLSVVKSLRQRCWIAKLKKLKSNNEITIVGEYKYERQRVCYQK